jgi:hypothetical protein
MNSVRCSGCKEPIISWTKYADWLTLYNFLEFLYLEDYIEKETRDTMIDALMSFKHYADEEGHDGS